MNEEKFIEKIKDLEKSLENLVASSCHNTISNNYSYILTEIDIHPKGNFYDQRLMEIEINRKKEPVSFENMVSELFTIYSNLYDINATIFQSLRKKTIIEFKYVLKSALEPYHQELTKNVEPMYHARLVTPFYLQDKSIIFDVNWQHQEWKNWWKRFRFLTKRKLDSSQLKS